MREIKFRAWDKQDKVMYEWPFIVHHFDDEIRVTKLDRSDFIRIPMSRIELMQFTGLKDKNGKEIYEGDIVKFGWVVDHLGAGDQTLKVKWNEDALRFDMPFGFDMHLSLSSNNFKYLEVIGNIYENPDLIKK